MWTTLKKYWLLLIIVIIYLVVAIWGYYYRQYVENHPKMYLYEKLDNHDDSMMLVYSKECTSKLIAFYSQDSTKSRSLDVLDDCMGFYQLVVLQCNAEAYVLEVDSIRKIAKVEASHLNGQGRPKSYTGYVLLKHLHQVPPDSCRLWPESILKD